MDKQLLSDWCDWLCGLLTPGTEVHSIVADAAKADGKRLHEEQAAAAVAVAMDWGLGVTDPDGMYADLKQLFYPGMAAGIGRRIRKGSLPGMTVQQALAAAAGGMFEERGW